MLARGGLCFSLGLLLLLPLPPLPELLLAMLLLFCRRACPPGLRWALRASAPSTWGVSCETSRRRRAQGQGTARHVALSACSCRCWKEFEAGHGTARRSALTHFRNKQCAAHFRTRRSVPPVVRLVHAVLAMLARGGLSSFLGLLLLLPLPPLPELPLAMLLLFCRRASFELPCGCLAVLRTLRITAVLCS
jgi:hypothetical protein